MIYLLSIMLGLSSLPTNVAKRQLLIFSVSKTQDAYLQQLNILKSDPVGLDERDITIRIIGEEDLQRSHFNVKSNEFCIILIGKDGSEKYRSEVPISLNQLYGLIDAMPMRKQEMKTRK